MKLPSFSSSTFAMEKVIDIPNHLMQVFRKNQVFLFLFHFLACFPSLVHDLVLQPSRLLDRRLDRKPNVPHNQLHGSILDLQASKMINYLRSCIEH